MGGAELPRKLPVALYVAEIELVPIGTADVVQLAAPVVRATFAHNVVPPALNVTVPVGVATLGAAEVVALNVMLCPLTAGFNEEVSAVVVGALEIVTATADEVAGLYPPAPEYVAVMVRFPRASDVDVHVACPATNGTVAQRVAVPFRNVTVPVGTAVLGGNPLTTAVKTTGWPKTAAADELDSTTRAFPAATATTDVGEALAEKLSSPA
jgi:hypothetical protein